jgi:hydrophobe/amphiphile efflux-1 (HAE1) family protein
VTTPAAPVAGAGQPEEVQYFFVKRPIFAMVISLVIVLLGLFSIRILPINTYPKITPPSVQITASYPGATAEQVCISVAGPIEQQLPGIQGLEYYKTSCSSDGSMTIQVYFDISRDLDQAAVDVQNEVTVATPQIPTEAQRLGIVVLKAQTDILMAFGFTSSDPRWDAAALSNYSRIFVQDELARVPGVGQATTFGSLQFAMLISLDPDRMAQLGLTVTDVYNAVTEQNATNPSGRIGREPAPQGTQFTVPVTALGRLTTTDEFSNIIVRAQKDGSVLKVKDIGSVTLGSQSYDAASRYNGRPTAGLIIYLRAGANALQVKQAVTARMIELKKTFPPGVDYVLGYDTTPFITASIREVVETLLIAMVLVTLVVYVFLQNWRSTLIPALAVPVSIIGTFGGMEILGFSINLLTLFGLILAIGIVVDDAIIVIENVERIMTAEKVSARIAADRAIRQVAGALIAIVLVLCSVFIPVAFLGGITGALFKQFAVTIVISVVLSGTVALTLTPALCSILLNDHTGERTTGFFGWFNREFDKARERYVNFMHHAVHYPIAAVGVLAVAVCLIVFLFRTTPTGFLPTEDKGYFIVAVELPGSSSMQRTTKVIEKVEQFLLHEDGVDHVFALSGFSLIQGVNQTSSGTIFVVLKPWEERKKKAQQVNGLLQASNGFFFTQIPDALVFGINAPEINGLGTTAGLELNLQDRSVNDIRKFTGLAQAFAKDLGATGDVVGVQTTIRDDSPTLYVDVDREKVKSLGIPLTDVFTTLQTMLSYNYVNDFNLYGKTYRVQLEAQAPFRQTPQDLNRFYVRSSTTNAMVPIGSLVHSSFRAGPTVVSRFNGFTSALVIGGVAPGKSSGEMLAAAEKLIRDKYEALGLSYGYSGQSYQEKQSSGQGTVVFMLGIIMAFLVLAAQYESWSTPFAVMIGVPFGILGALLGLQILHSPNDLYFEVGLLVVIGLEAKNAILIVEFAIEQRLNFGQTIEESAIIAGRERIRPILMTSFAFILGVVPLLIATGAGAAARHSLGTGVFFGMVLSTLLGVNIIPNLFIFVRKIAEGQTFGGKRPAAASTPPGIAAAPAGDD